ncbi:MAG: ribonuclease P protein component [Anaerolineae bacterium]|nr:ribonuclease P protein component [Anaerolineae bacterium]
MQQHLRLRQRDDFQRVRETGHTCQDHWLIINVAPGTLPHNRYGIITGKRVGSAVARNRIRRLLKEALRLLHARLDQGYDVVVIARPAVAGQSLAAIQQRLSRLCQQAGIVKDTT